VADKSVEQIGGSLVLLATYNILYPQNRENDLTFFDNRVCVHAGQQYVPSQSVYV
jgi:hypothetical protein